ncbi:glycosyltransferase family 2 protein [Selenomonas caprae]|uniref:Glycosyltransferase family 2 protein n=1 Tax=Selenomonas caprae TaxID=2606905 RepID=A0A5D6WS69_9FIRM|nr:glycosyltransferase [Selenomonas caprae]TYZ29818.1 glycosyltransferase family 2 protein [Selenomonas caprae]
MTYLSLCIPTNGVSEWVFPVLDNIFDQNENSELYEVVVTNNGDSDEFHEKMKKYAQRYENLVYKKTSAYMFENQIEALRLAKGRYLKFINHRSVLEAGTIRWMVSIIKEYSREKPVIYFSNGMLPMRNEVEEYRDFDGFVKGLKHIASWTTGVGVWKSDFHKIPSDHKYNKISPHSDVLFAERKRNRYIINNKKWAHDIYDGHENKGEYDLYKTFAIDEISIIFDLYRGGDISVDTLKSTVKSYRKFVANCYLKFNIMRIPCSYMIDGFDKSMGVFMDKWEILIMAYIGVPIMMLKNLKRKICEYV